MKSCEKRLFTPACKTLDRELAGRNADSKQSGSAFAGPLGFFVYGRFFVLW